MGSDAVRKSARFRHSSNVLSVFFSSRIPTGGWSSNSLVRAFVLLSLLFGFLRGIIYLREDRDQDGVSTENSNGHRDIHTENKSKIRRRNLEKASYYSSESYYHDGAEIRGISKEEIDVAREELPRQCWSLLESLSTCQSSAETIVFGCHRKWCPRGGGGSGLLSSMFRIPSHGHCEEVNGIGDRTQRMLSMATDAIDKCIRIEMDYPQSQNGIDLRFSSSLEYVDAMYPLSEMFHFRSYDVSDQGPVQVEEWGKLSSKADSNGGGSRTQKKVSTFAHFTPRDYHWHHYDPCLYHILFQKSPELQSKLDYYFNLFHLGNGQDHGSNESDRDGSGGGENGRTRQHDDQNTNDTNNVIGIHFRTGDLTAFGVDNKDVRAQGRSLEDSYHKMVSCAEKLAEKLKVRRHWNEGGEDSDSSGVSNGNRNREDNGKYQFFLATDNQHVKEMAKNDERYVIYMTDDEPSPYLSSSGDWSAYLDLYMLSMTRGLAVNVLPDTYDGPAERVSTFARLAWNIAFMNENQLYECAIS